MLKKIYIYLWLWTCVLRILLFTISKSYPILDYVLHLFVKCLQFPFTSIFFFFWLEINSIFVCWFLVSFTNPVKTIYIYFWFLKWNSCLSCILLNLLFLYCSCPRDTYTRCQINTRYFNNCLKWKQEESVI